MKNQLVEKEGVKTIGASRFERGISVDGAAFPGVSPNCHRTTRCGQAVSLGAAGRGACNILSALVISITIIAFTSTSASASVDTWTRHILKTDSKYMAEYSIEVPVEGSRIICSILVPREGDALYLSAFDHDFRQHVKISGGRLVSNDVSKDQYSGNAGFEFVDSGYEVFSTHCRDKLSALPNNIKRRFGDTFDINYKGSFR